MPENWFFGVFARFHHQFLMTFCSKMRNSNGQSMAQSKEYFFPAENAGNMPEIAVFAHFYLYFSLDFFFFSHIKYSSQQLPTFFKNCRKAGSRAVKNGFSSISRVLLNISFTNFCSILSFARFSVCFPFLSNFHHQAGRSNQHSACFHCFSLIVMFYTKQMNYIFIRLGNACEYNSFRIGRVQTLFRPAWHL